MPVTFTGNIEVSAVDNIFHFDVVDSETGASLVKFLQSLKERYPDITLVVEVFAVEYESSTGKPFAVIRMDGYDATADYDDETVEYDD